jgi:hypothetical protein
MVLLVTAIHVQILSGLRHEWTGGGAVTEEEEGEGMKEGRMTSEEEIWQSGECFNY